LKREVLLSKLERVINIIERDRDLPLDIKEVYIFGSFVRGKEEPGDLDLIMVHSELGPKQAELTARAIEGHGTSLDQQMNGRLKSNSENIDVVYGTSLEAVIHLLKVKPSTIEKIWSKDDRDWREKLRRIQSRSPEERIGILERELESLREYTRRLQYNLIAYQRVVMPKLSGPELTKFHLELVARVEEVKKNKNFEPFVLLP
jgi:predicted nucleotidyltransferase